MLRLVYLLGSLLVLLAAGVLVGELLGLAVRGAYRPIPLTAIWYGLHPDSLVAVQGLIQERVSPAAWPPVFWLLGQPATLLLGLPGIVLMLLGRRPGSRRGF